MAKRHRPEEIVTKLRQVDGELPRLRAGLEELVGWFEDGCGVDDANL